jgi:hypothetical protein
MDFKFNVDAPAENNVRKKTFSSTKEKLEYEKRLRSAGISKITRTSLEKERSKRLSKTPTASISTETANRSEKKRHRDEYFEDSSSKRRRKDVIVPSEGSSKVADEIGISFLLELFSSNYFLRHDFVYAWSSKIRTKINMTANEESEANVVVPNFETDLCCCLCFVLFSPINVVAEASCFTLFSELDFESYFTENGYSVLDERYQYKDPEHANCKAERGKISNILKGCWKEIYVEYSSIPTTCHAFLAMLVKRSNSISNAITEVSRFKKFMFYAVLVELVETLFYNIKQVYTQHKLRNSDGRISKETMDALDESAVEIVVIALIHFKNTFAARLSLSQIRFFDNLIPRGCRDGVQVVDHFETVFFNDWIW